jgi:hypothetical protein
VLRLGPLSHGFFSVEPANAYPTLELHPRENVSNCTPAKPLAESAVIPAARAGN